MEADPESKTAGSVPEALAPKKTVASPAPPDGNGQQAILREVRQFIRTELETHSGPLPSPKQLQEYEKCSKGTINRIIKMAEDDARHRREMEAQLVAAHSEDRRAERRERARAQYCAVVVCALFLTAAVCIAVFAGAPVSGTIFAGGTLTAVIGFFLVQKHQESRQKIENQGDESESEGSSRESHSETHHALTVRETQRRDTRWRQSGTKGEQP